MHPTDDDGRPDDGRPDAAEPATPAPPADTGPSPPTGLDPARATVIGAGPAGLMAAEALAARGVAVQVLDGMPSVGRKFLLAGKGGLNLTHAEPLPRFVERYGARAPAVAAWLDRLGPQAVRDWAAALGVPTFVGSSSRVFPQDLRAAPLLRAWLHRLRGQGVRFLMRHRWQGWDADGALVVATPHGERRVVPQGPVVLALGGASWQRLGSDGAWWPWLAARGVELAPLEPSNCGFDLPDPGWSPFLRDRFAGAPLKNVALRVPGPTVDAPPRFEQKGECVVTATGLEGSLVYAASAAIRDALHASAGEPVTVTLDLLADRDAAFVAAEVARPRGSRSLATHLKSRLSVDGVKAALLHEALGRGAQPDAARVAALLKALPVTLARARPIDEAISTAGGVQLEALDERLMLRALPGVFVAGEMLDWEAPTGGYLLTAAMASGRVAGEGAADWATSRRASA